jgi:hypothetical protein
MADPWEWLLINDSMAQYQSSLARLDRTEQLIEQSRKAMIESRELLQQTRPIELSGLVAHR